MLLHSDLRSASDDLRGYNGWRCFVYPETAIWPTTYILSEENSVRRLQEAFPEGTLQTEGLSNVYGYADYYSAYHIGPGESAALVPQERVDRSWSEQITLLGYDLQDETIVPGESLEITLYWSPLQEMDTRYTAFVHLLGPQNPQTGNPIWGQKDSEPCEGFYPTAVWREGEVIRDDINFALDPSTPPGSYTIAVGFYTWPDFKRLPVEDMDFVALQEIEVVDP